MSKHNDKAFSDALKSKFQTGFQNSFQNGLAQGMYAACKVVGDMTNNEKMTDAEKVVRIRSFCETMLKDADEKLKIKKS